MNVVTHDDTTVTLDTGVKQTRTVKTPKLVVARLCALGIESKPPIRARRIFESVCRFYATFKRLALVLLPDQPIRHEGFAFHPSVRGGSCRMYLTIMVLRKCG